MRNRSSNEMLAEISSSVLLRMFGAKPLRASGEYRLSASRTSPLHPRAPHVASAHAAVKGLRALRALRSLRDSLRSPLTAASLRLPGLYGGQVDLPAECQRAGALLSSGGPDGSRRSDGEEHPSVV